MVAGLEFTRMTRNPLHAGLYTLARQSSQTHTLTDNNRARTQNQDTFYICTFGMALLLLIT